MRSFPVARKEGDINFSNMTPLLPQVIKRGREQIPPQPQDILANLPAPKRGFPIESLEGQGTLDPEWIVTWAQILCHLLEWSQGADPSELMRVIGLCSVGEEYDIVDLLQDVRLYAETKHCEEPLERREEACFGCMRLKEPDWEPDDEALDWAYNREDIDVICESAERVWDAVSQQKVWDKCDHDNLDFF